MERTDYCPDCKVVVAPGDPERVVNKHGVWHGGCWKKIQKIKESIAKLPVVVGQPINWQIM
jgi:hypothetical protein